MTACLPEPTVPRAPLLEYLEHSDCAFCSDGSLNQMMFDGNDAVVCDNCGTPAAQVW
ncbi:HVO_A0556 family zinc finger protein [Natrialbaceae archaeon AArc-T1-2]|uniref:HVO_A0556 family zinc finger protein n=1 Tax=Natrialbaceae archaeon AArc-T1-2 TaxID=3053904 RepID=UPI0031F333A7